MRRRKFKKKRFKTNRPNSGSTKRKRMLNMHGVSTFNYELENLLNKLPESDRRPVFASIYSKASNISIEEAEEFINTRVVEGIIPKDLSLELITLLNKHSRYR